MSQEKFATNWRANNFVSHLFVSQFFNTNELAPCFERFCIKIGIKILSNVFPFF